MNDEEMLNSITEILLKNKITRYLEQMFKEVDDCPFGKEVLRHLVAEVERLKEKTK